jgi:hypothetical protein
VKNPVTSSIVFAEHLQVECADGDSDGRQAYPNEVASNFKRCRLRGEAVSGRCQFTAHEFPQNTMAHHSTFSRSHLLILSPTGNSILPLSYSHFPPERRGNISRCTTTCRTSEYDTSSGSRYKAVHARCTTADAPTDIERTIAIVL